MGSGELAAWVPDNYRFGFRRISGCICCGAPRICPDRAQSEQFPVSAYAGSSKKLKDLKDLKVRPRTLIANCSLERAP